MAAPWRKLGRVLEASGSPLSRSHAMLPTPWRMTDRVRVFYASCDADLRGRVFCADFALEPPFRVIGVNPDPVLDVGAPGAFDADGVNPSQIVEDEAGLALLYIGWRRGSAEAPYTLSAGLARSDDQGLSFTRSLQPLLPPLPGERFFRTAPFLHRDERGYRLLYIGGDAFVDANDGRRTPIYSLMELRSGNPWKWTGPGRILMAPDIEAGETGFGRPVVTPGGRLMLSIRTRAGYRLVEMDLPSDARVRPPLTPAIPPPYETWEAGMTCFGAPCVVGDHELLFYNGDGYGRTGMGMAWRPRN